MHAFCLKYKAAAVSAADEALIIGVSVAGAVLVLIIISLVVVICIMRRKRRKPKEEVELRPKKVADDISSPLERPSNVTQAGDYLTPIEPPLTSFTVEAEVVPASAESNDYSSHRHSFSDDDTWSSSSDDLVFEYEPNDPALAFDLRKIEFKESHFRLPRVNIGGLNTLQIYDVPQDDSFSVA